MGTINPVYPLQVQGDTYIGGNLIVDKKKLILAEKNNGSADGMGMKYVNASTISIYSDAIVEFRESDANVAKVVIDVNNARVGIGKLSPSYALDVEGTVRATTFSASNPPSWPDYVFDNTYKLSKIEAVEKYIAENHHLPEIPSAAEVKANGVDIVDMQAKLLQKIEELTLYVIELKKENEIQQREIEKLKRQ